MMIRWVSAIALALAAASASAQVFRHPPYYEQAGRPTCPAFPPRLIIVTNAQSVTDCDMEDAPGTSHAPCWCLGGVWVATPGTVFTPSTLATDYSLFPGGNVDLGAFYLDVGAIATPANPAGGRRLFVDSGTGELSVRDAAGTTTSLEAGRLRVSQTAHGFSVGQWAMHDNATDAWELLDATAVDGDNRAVGFVAYVEDANTFLLAVAGPASWTHGQPIGPLYASSTPGVLTSTAPALGTVEWMVAVASSTDFVVVVQMVWYQL